MKKQDYVDNVLIKLRRQYSKDEVVKALSNKLTEKDIEIGSLKSEIDYLSIKLKEDKEQREINRLSKIESRNNEIYQIQLDTNKKQRKKIKDLIATRNDLIGQVSQLKSICSHPFEKVISCGKEHNCTKCGKNI